MTMIGECKLCGDVVFSGWKHKCKEASIINQDYLLLLIRFFQEHGGYWWIDQSESHNLSIEWHPFIGDGKGGYVPKIFRKRVFDIKEFYEECQEIISKYLEGK